MKRVSIYFLAICTLAICVHQALSKDCIFLHGSGEIGFSAPTTTFEAYWGDVQNFVNNCNTVTFNHADTVHYAFDDPLLMKSYCSISADSDGIIRNKTLFTHSMGNNILAAAIKHKVCDIDTQSSLWYGISAPLLGSQVIPVLYSVCNNTGIVEKPIRWIAKKLNYCSNSSSAPNLSYLSLSPSNPALEGLSDVFKSKVSGMMCGTSPFGLTSDYSIPLDALSELVGFGEPNDGLVGIASCVIGGGVFQNDSVSEAYYEGPFNHADTTCRNGRTPCYWYSSRTV